MRFMLYEIHCVDTFLFSQIFLPFTNSHVLNGIRTLERLLPFSCKMVRSTLVHAGTIAVLTLQHRTKNQFPVWYGTHWNNNYFRSPTRTNSKCSTRQRTRTTTRPRRSTAPQKSPTINNLPNDCQAFVHKVLQINHSIIYKYRSTIYFVATNTLPRKVPSRTTYPLPRAVNENETILVPQPRQIHRSPPLRRPYQLPPANTTA